MRGDPSSLPARVVAGGGYGDGEPHMGEPTVIGCMKSSSAHRFFDFCLAAVSSAEVSSFWYVIVRGRNSTYL